MFDVTLQHAFEHRVKPLHARIVEIPGATAWFEQKESVSEECGRIEVIGIQFGQHLHCFGIGFVLFSPCVDLEVLDVTYRERVDIRTFLGRGMYLR